MVLNGMSDQIITKGYPGGSSAETDLYMKPSKDITSNTFNSEMAMRNLKDFKGRSRTNMVPRVAKRINDVEKKAKDHGSMMTST